MRKIQWYLLVLTILTIASCKSASKIQQTNQEKPEGVDPSKIESVFSFSNGDTTQVIVLDNEEAEAVVVARIQKTPCYGNCPVFEAKVFSNGLVLFDGKENTDRLGLHEAYMLQSQMDSLLTQATAIDFFKMNANYPANGKQLYDLPSTILFVKQEDQEKEITNNHGAPKGLKAYEALFLDMLNRLDWRSVDEVD